MTAPLATLITGASSGLGREIARRLSQTRRLILGGRDLDRLEATRRECARSDEHLIWPLDLANVSAIDASLTGCMTETGVRVDEFVHCAGLLKLMRFRMMDLESATATMNVNFMSASQIIRVLLKKSLNEHQLKNVVFVSSTASQFGARGFNMYCASKGALDALMRALAVELAPAVRLNSVLPGAVQTDMTAGMFADPAVRQSMEKDYPLGVGQPSDIAAAVEFLLSENARWITGQQLVVDGGRTINISA